MVQLLFRPLCRSMTNDLYVSIAIEPPPGSLLTLPFSRCVHHLSTPNTCLTQSTFKITECTQTHIDTHIHTCTLYTPIHVHIHIHIHIDIHVIMNHQGHNNVRNGTVWVQNKPQTVTLNVIEPRTHQKFESRKRR